MRRTGCDFVVTGEAELKRLSLCGPPTTMPEATTQKLLEAKAAGIGEHLGTARRGHRSNSKLRPRGMAEPLKAPGP